MTNFFERQKQLKKELDNWVDSGDISSDAPFLDYEDFCMENMDKVCEMLKRAYKFIYCDCKELGCFDCEITQEIELELEKLNEGV